MIGAECSAIAGRFAPTPPGSDVSAELQHDGSVQIEFEYHFGDEAVLNAVREPSSTSLLSCSPSSVSPTCVLSGFAQVLFIAMPKAGGGAFKTTVEQALMPGLVKA
jgi:hypothetical protein